MIHILEELKQEIDKEVIEQSKKLAKELEILEKKALPGGAKEKRKRGFEVDTLRRKLETLTSPVVSFTCDLFDFEIGRLQGREDIRVVRSEKYKNGETTIMHRFCETDFFLIERVVDLFLGGKSKIRTLRHSSIDKIFVAVEEIEAEINKIDLTEEIVEMRDSQYREIKELIDDRRKTSNPFPQFSDYQKLIQKNENARNLIEDFLKWPGKTKDFFKVKK